MNVPDWFILIYETADAEAQEHLHRELQSFGRLIVQTEEDRGEHIVVIECPGTLTALAIHELVMSIDAQATLIDTHSGPKHEAGASESSRRMASARLTALSNQESRFLSRADWRSPQGG